ncbi:hypothetical protein TPA0598_07_07960 [Streptomyces lydicamycinicus]|uniref:Uncharacterized protein n=1 Tax=Streptomyces lydicamycinicus TaxID=1546107 RepID=A0A0P4RBX0_9ACTN|nr:hypothetical protein TPA0598_07_07960 [Streptomyces lydicamycinicus]
MYGLASAVGTSVMQSVVALRLSQASQAAEDASARLYDALAEGITRALTVGCLFPLVCVPVAVIAFSRPASRHRSRPTGGSTVAT